MVSQDILRLPVKPSRSAQRAPGSAVGIGASAGGLMALGRLFEHLPADFKAPVFVVLHIGDRPSEFPALLARHSAMPCHYAHDREEVRPGRIYIAPPDCHMIVEQDRILLTRGPRENWARPSIDVLLRALAWEYGDDAIGVILTGGLKDGTAGLYEVKRRGGTAIVQDPAEAEMPSMPQSALDNVAVDYRLALEKIPACLTKITEEKSTRRATRQKGGRAMEGSYRQDEPVALSCPECGGAMRREAVGKFTRYRCHIGHALSAEDMAAAQVEIVERSLETAVRALNENRVLCQQIASAAKGEPGLWADAHEEAERRLKALQKILEERVDTQSDSGATLGPTSSAASG
jgi:two-component system chemotaxis response regulator CheB